MSHFKIAIIVVLWVWLIAFQASGVLQANSSRQNGGAQPNSQARFLATSTPEPLAAGTPTLVPTLAAIAIDLPAFDGQLDVELSSDFTERPDSGTTQSPLFEFGATAANLEIKNNNTRGAGIAYVDLFIIDANNRVVDSKRENNFPYCYTGENGNECAVWDFSKQRNTWVNGTPVRDGVYFARAVSFNTNHTKMRVDERVFYIDRSARLAGQPFVFGSVNVNRPNGNDPGILSFDATVSNNGLPINYVEMSIIDPRGTVIYTRRMTFAPFCAFGASPVDGCNDWNFAQHNNRFPGPLGAPLTKSIYSFRVTVTAGNLGVVAAEVNSESISDKGFVPLPANPTTPSGGVSNGGGSGGGGSCAGAICVTRIGVSPNPGQRNQDQSFAVTFLNGTGSTLTLHNFIILSYRQGESKIFGESPSQTVTLPPGESTSSVPFTVVHGRGGGCEPYYARAGIHNSPTDKYPLPNVSGGPAEVLFQVC